MDRFLTFEGEQPIFLDDFNFMQDAMKETIKKVVQTIIRDDRCDNCILYGCEITDEEKTPGHHVVSWTDGIVMLEGEVFPVKSDSIEIVTESFDELYLYFHIIETNDLNGDRTFKDGEKHNCYQRRHVTINGDSSNGYFVYEVTKIEDYVREELQQIYYIRDDTKMVEANLLHPFGGGWYLSVNLERKLASSSRVNTIIPDTDVSKFMKKGLRTGTTYGILKYYQEDTGVIITLNVTISIMYKDNHLYLNVKYVGTQGLPVGKAQLYCRLEGW